MPFEHSMAAKHPKKHVENEQLAAVLCYFLVGVIWFFADKKMYKSSLVHFHSKQVINLWIINILLNFVVAIFPFSLAFVGSIANLMLLALWVVGLIRAVNQEEKEIPIVGQLADGYLKY